MPFLGVEPTDTFASVEKQTITGNGGTDYTLTNAVGASQDIALFINNVRQEPGSAYTVSGGTDLVISESLLSSDDCYLVYIGRTFQSAYSSGTTKGVFYENNQILYQDVTIDANKNAMATGPITIQSGVTLTVHPGARVVIL